MTAETAPGGNVEGLIGGAGGGFRRSADWLRRNLFSSLSNTLLTLIVLAFSGPSCRRS